LAYQLDKAEYDLRPAILLCLYRYGKQIAIIMKVHNAERRVVQLDDLGCCLKGAKADEI
jgi:hypothetical protein